MKNKYILLLMFLCIYNKTTLPITKKQTSKTPSIEETYSVKKALSFASRLLVFTAAKECAQIPLLHLKDKNLYFKIMCSFIPYVCAYIAQECYDQTLLYGPKIGQHVLNRKWRNDFSYDQNFDY